MNFDDINWDEMWREECAQAPWKDEASSEDLWDRRAARFNKGVKPRNESPAADRSDYISQMLDRIHIQPDWTVLDIGCGPGTLAIPLAQKAKKVTGLDVSSEMLKFLRHNAEKSGLDNIDCIKAGWQDAFDGGRIEPYDVVVASRSLMGAEIKSAMATIDAIARHGAYITFPIMHLSFDWDAYEAIGRARKRHPRYIYVLNMLHQMNIQANLEILHSKMRLKFSSIEDAIDQLSWRTDPFSEEERIKLREYLKDSLASQSGPPFVHQGKSVWALVWWKKAGIEKPNFTGC